MKRWMGVTLMVLVVAGGRALGVGVLVPKDEKVPPLATKYLRVDARIDNQVARTVVEQVFQNSTNRDLEARYVFPLPADASVHVFAETGSGGINLDVPNAMLRRMSRDEIELEIGGGDARLEIDTGSGGITLRTR